jgi:hypothetical protein
MVVGAHEMIVALSEITGRDIAGSEVRGQLPRRHSYLVRRMDIATAWGQLYSIYDYMGIYGYLRKGAFVGADSSAYA